MTSAVLDLVSDPSGIDPDEYVRELMKWHFSSDTGSPYWLRRAALLDFDPRTDIKTAADLALFPNVVDDFRDVKVEDLIPQGLGPAPAIAGVFESGGTTGAPKRLVFFEEWVEAIVAWENWPGSLRAQRDPVNILAVVPSGPHMLGELAARQSRRAGGLRFSVDLDPRWVKRLIAQGKQEEANAYAEHVVDQAANILRTQRIDLLVTTPPLLERFARRSELVDMINASVRRIHWGGARMDADTRDLYRREVFPNVVVQGAYGSTTILGGTRERPGEDFHGEPIFDTFSPYVFFRVMDPDTGRDVTPGHRGQVVMNHITKYALIPNNPERDTAYCVPPLSGALGCAVSGIAPTAEFGGHEVIEGVY
ncbi:AMP-binding protein [Nocardia goodfellowii]|uniref:AMP-dependent synthetase/ligase domain-containing protein n=1 Tax=Nocardia goodfellowii TaxID=882446 RepID=A0ABS4QR49_9NOCA|nr:AMP-binding protein [Nocardia goodfellowii]MBP2193121.1 hypothetical protein [Nocardia goodfellowii]